MADGHRAGQGLQDLAVENLRDQPHAFMFVETAIVAGDDAGAFLAAMLQGVEAVVRQFSGVGMAVNAEHAAIMFWMVVCQIQRRQCRAARRKFKKEAEVSRP